MFDHQPKRLLVLKLGQDYINLKSRSALYVAFLFFCVLRSFSLHGQDRSVRFQYLTTEDGLSQNMVDCMLQDSQGFMWFGTWNGLCRYDGYNFEVFNNENGRPNTLKNNFIYSLTGDQFGNIWIGTAEGLHVYLYDKGQFIRSADLLGDNGSDLSGIVKSLVGFKDSFVLAGSTLGLYQLNILDEHGRFKIIRHFPYGTGEESIDGTVINLITVDTKSNVWVGTDNGIDMFNPELLKIGHLMGDPERTEGLSSNMVLDIYESTSGDFWIGTEFGLNRYDPYSGHFKQYQNDPSDPGSLLHNSVMDILEDRSGNVLIGTLGGLSVLDKSTGRFSNYKNETNSEHSINNDFVNCLLKDDKDNIWIGTERGGVNFYNSNQNTIEHFEFDIWNKNSLSNSTINSIYEDKYHLWIGTAGGGLNRYNKKIGRFHHYRFSPTNERSISSDFVTSIYRHSSGQLWVGTWGSGLNILVNEGKKDEYFQRYSGPAEVSGLVSSFISSIAEDHHGNLWFGTLGGIVIYDVKGGTFKTVFSGNDPVRITGVGCLLFDAENSLWVGTRTGLFHLQKASQFGYKVVEYRHNPSDKHSLSGNYVISGIQDTRGNIWFGTYGQGIDRLHEEGDSIWFETLTTADGISNNIIYGIEEDNQGELWLSTDYGLSRLNPDTRKVRNFYISDGFQNNQYYWSASYKNKSGKLYFGGMNGLDSFYPDWINEVILNPEVVITDVKLLNESVVPGRKYNGIKVLSNSVSKTSELNLSYKEKSFAIEFSSFNYQEPGMIRYAYILEDFEDSWNYVLSNRRYANYTNLKPGHYTFHVKASGSNGEFTAPAKTLEIHIAPPFWETPWFTTLSVCVLVVMIFGYIRFRIYNLKRQKMILEKQVEERTERINEQKEALSFQAIQLQDNNQELERNQELIEGQNHKLEAQNKEILTQRDKLIELNKKLKLVSQLKLSFFTNISHEFRTPLTLIISPLERLIKENNLNLDVKNTLNIINRNAQRLLHLVNQIMDFRKIEKGRMELKVTRGNISDFCENIFNAFKPLSHAKEINFGYNAKEIPREVWFDAQKVENILYNLLSNAFKYTKNEGDVSFEVRGLTFEESKLKYRETLDEEDKTVISIKISDSGVGISEENLPLVFKQFYRIESEEAFKINGSGIGLALTEELIKTHHGEIFVESALGKGSVFEIQFPCLRASYGTNEVIESARDYLNIYQQVEILKNEMFVNDEQGQDEEDYVFEKERPTLLVVEDNTDLRKFIAHRFNKTYNILEAEDGEVGWKLAKKSNPDIVVSDVMMPKRDGLELCAMIKNNLGTSHVPVILLTAKSAVEDQIDGLKIGADNYLPKPFNFDLLEARVQNLIGSRNKLRKQFLESGSFDVNTSTTNTKDQKFLEHTIRVVNDNLADSGFDIGEFVKYMGISRSLLHKKLTALTGQSATEFINHLKMKKALTLLKQNEMNVSEVAYSVGYNDPKYFTRLFGKYYGQSPKEFLKKEEVSEV